MAKRKVKRKSVKKIETEIVECPYCGYKNEIRKGFNRRVCDSCYKSFIVRSLSEEKELQDIIVYYKNPNRKPEIYNTMEGEIEISATGIVINENNIRTIITIHSIEKIIATYKTNTKR